MNERAGGTLVEDFSGYGNNGTWNGNASSNVTTGKFGNALLFDGIDDRISIPVLNVGTVHSATIWIDYQDSNDGVIIGRYGLWPNSGYLFYIDQNNVYYNSGGYNGADYVFVSHNGLTPGTWYNLAVVRNGRSVTFYKNGIQLGTTQTLLTNTPISDIVSIGSYGNGNVPTAMRLDEVRIYNRDISTDEINSTYNAGLFRLYNNFTNIPEGTYSYQAYAQNSSGDVSQTEERTLTVAFPPSIVGFAPGSPLENVPGDSRSFYITLNQNMDVTWYLNGTPVGFNGSVTQAKYTNTSAQEGSWNVTAAATNSKGIAMMTWIWKVSPAGINFIDPTPLDGATLDRNFVNINTSISSPENSAAFIDWNRSLVGWWRFNGEADETSAFFRDWSSWGNNVTCTVPCPSSTTGKFGNALKFNTNTLLSNSASTILNFNGIVDYSVSAWTKTSGADYPVSDSAVAGKWFGFKGWMLYFPGSGAVAVYADANKFQSAPGVYTNDGAWHHIVGVKNGSTGYVYIDGLLKGSGPIGQCTITGTSSEFDIGTYSGGAGSKFFDGTIDDVLVFNRVLSEAEIRASYDAGISRLFNNFTNIANGHYTYQAYLQSPSGEVSQTEIRTLNIHALTLESFNDSAHLNIDNNFGAGESTVYIFGTGFLPGETYKVAYYDGGNNHTKTVIKNSDISGDLSDDYSFNPGKDEPGTWHAQVFNVTGGPSGTYTYSGLKYSNSAPGLLIEDSFEVDASAIPEFPAGIVIPFAASLIAFAYLRKRIENGKK
jgi:hypothetical protein